MFWLYFARDFYQAGKVAAPTQRTVNHRIAHSVLATPVFRNLTKLNGKSHLHPEPELSLSSYLQRLSVEGDDAFGVWDQEAGFSIFSANFERVTGLPSGECAGHGWIHGIHHDQQYAMNEALLNATHGIDGRCLVQASAEADGWRWLMVDIKAPTTRQPQVMVLFRDLSEQKALEETLKQVESALAISERGRSAFLSSMSHELRTPLNAIMGFSEMMKSGVFGQIDNPTYQQYVQHIHESGCALLQKVDDLLDIASMDVGKLALEEGEFQLKDMLNEVIEIHSHQAFSRNVTIKMDCLYLMMVHGDRAKLICAVSHLLTNALRHSKEGSEISINVRAQLDEGAIISVRDSGEGIAPKQLEIIRHALSANVTYFNIESGGIGLGLSLSKELASRHGGKIMIDSIRHRGTVVSLVIPSERVVSGMPQKRRKQQ